MEKVLNVIYVLINIILLILWITIISNFIGNYGVDSTGNGGNFLLQQIAYFGFYIILFQLIIVELVRHFKIRKQEKILKTPKPFSWSINTKELSNILFTISLFIFVVWPFIDAHKPNISDYNKYPMFFGGINPVIFFIPPVISFLLLVTSFFISLKYVYKEKGSSWKVANIIYRICGMIICLVLFYLFALTAHGIDNYGGGTFF